MTVDKPKLPEPTKQQTKTRQDYQKTLDRVRQAKSQNVKNERSVKALYNEIEKVLRNLNYEIKPKKEVISIMEGPWEE